MIVSVVSIYETYLGGLFVRLTFPPFVQFGGNHCGALVFVW